MFRLLAKTSDSETLAIDRLSVITDGVYAIVLTLLVLELHIPGDLAPGAIVPALIASLPKFAAFGIAFSAAAIGWTFTYLSHSVLRSSNFLHLVFTLVSLAFVSLIPFVSAMMGSYPDSPWGYVPYCLDIAGLCLVYTLDGVICGRRLAHRAVSAPLLAVLWLSTAACGLLALFGGTYLAFYSPRLTFWVIVVGSLTIWVDYWLLSRAVGRALAAPD